MKKKIHRKCRRVSNLTNNKVRRFWELDIKEEMFIKKMKLSSAILSYKLSDRYEPAMEIIN